jgi:hypothetical protein
MTSRRKEFVVKKITFTLIGILLLSAAAAAQSVALSASTLSQWIANGYSRIRPSLCETVSSPRSQVSEK